MSENKETNKTEYVIEDEKDLFEGHRKYLDGLRIEYHQSLDEVKMLEQQIDVLKIKVQNIDVFLPHLETKELELHKEVLEYQTNKEQIEKEGWRKRRKVHKYKERMKELEDMIPQLKDERV